MPAEHARKKRKPINLRSVTLKAGTLLVCLAAWLYLTTVLKVDAIYLPSPLDLWDRFMAMSRQLPSALAYSLTIIVGGYLIGSIAGIILALVMAYSVIVRESLEPIVDALRPVPIFALIPLFLLWFGVGFPSQVALVAFGCFVILVVSTTEAVKNVPRIYVNAARTLGAGRSQVFRTIVVPAIMPNLVGAMRVAGAASFGLDVGAEFIGSQNGLGYLMINSAAYLHTDGIIVIAIIYTILAVLLDRIIALLTNRIVGWADRTEH
jgi:ABC-type nitrate/sulfonate/bicarbonate transport system permease component